MLRSLKFTQIPCRLVAGFLVTKKLATGTKKPATKKPGTTYKYV